MEIEIQLLPLFLRVSVFLHNVDSVIPSQQPDTACSLKPFSKWQVLDGIAERIQPSAARSARWFRRAPLVRSRAMTRLTRGSAPGLQGDEASFQCPDIAGPPSQPRRIVIDALEQGGTSARLSTERHFHPLNLSTTEGWSPSAAAWNPPMCSESDVRLLTRRRPSGSFRHPTSINPLPFEDRNGRG
jgi:hypothetical protein